MENRKTDQGHLVKSRGNYMKIYTHRLLALDVWSNSKDGYEVNNAISCDETVELNDSMSDSDLIKAIRKSLGHRQDSRGYYIEGELEFGLYIYRKKDSKPCYFTKIESEGA
jgi:hypothetical protein